MTTTIELPDNGFHVEPFDNQQRDLPEPRTDEERELLAQVVPYQSSLGCWGHRDYLPDIDYDAEPDEPGRFPRDEFKKRLYELLVLDGAKIQVGYMLSCRCLNPLCVRPDHRIPVMRRPDPGSWTRQEATRSATRQNWKDWPQRLKSATAAIDQHTVTARRPEPKFPADLFQWKSARKQRVITFEALLSRALEYNTLLLDAEQPEDALRVLEDTWAAISSRAEAFRASLALARAARAEARSEGADDDKPGLHLPGLVADFRSALKAARALRNGR